MFRDFRSALQDSDTLGFTPPGRAVGRGGKLPPVAIPESNSEVKGIDLTQIIHVDDFKYAKPDGTPGGGKPGGGGGGGGGFTPAPYTSGPADAASGFNITIVFEGTWSQSLYDIFVAAADFYSALIVGDVTNVISGRGKRAVEIDDITITASLINIDGAGAVLGRAGPTSVRTGSSLPATAIMEFDIADADAFDAINLFDDIVLHEMGHALGFGTIWDRLGLIDADNNFAGLLAQAESLAQFGTTDIAVETDGGSGTAFGHWDDQTYTNELMTGYISDPNYYSYMSAASFGDLGYELAANYRAVVDELNLA